MAVQPQQDSGQLLRLTTFAATATTLFLGPAFFAVLQGRAPLRSVSLDPEDHASAHFGPKPDEIPAAAPAVETKP